ncbi:MAG: NnrU family protein [Myxococcota bacterium]
MDPVLRVALGLALFAATHLGLAWPPLRQPIAARLGRLGFIVFFWVVAWLTSGIAVFVYAAHASEGPAGLALGAHGAARPVLITLIALGSMLMTGAFGGYASSPYAMSGAHVSEPRGLERVTRHPFFVGFSLLGAAHALLATRLVGAVFMGGLAAIAWFGAQLQDRKLAALRGDTYRRYLAISSMLPFAAIAAGRQRFVPSELPYGALLVGLPLAWLLRTVHGSLFAHGGAYVMAALVIGPLVILLAEWRRDRRARRVATSGVMG